MSYLDMPFQDILRLADGVDDEGFRLCNFPDFEFLSCC